MTLSRTDPCDAPPTKEQPSSMEPVMQKTFCGCCSLKTGTLTCGVFCLLFSTLVIVTDAMEDIRYPEHYNMNKSVLLKGIIGLIVSAFCIHGAVKENRYSLLPWLVVAAITITMHFLTAFYLILYGTFDITMVGLTLVAASGLLTYCWFCVANYYTELRDRAYSDSSPAPMTRHYINPSAVTSPAAFTTPPPTYSVVVEGEKPPCYEEAKKIKEKAELEQQQQQHSDV